MNFIDRTGHIFALTSYDEYPIGYEYQETPYKFWFENEKGQALSVDNYYFKPIRIVTRINETDKVELDIKIENSNKFWLIDSKTIDDKLLKLSTISDSIEIFENAIRESQSLHYEETINLSGESDFQGCIVEESVVQYGVQKYWINAYSREEYTGETYSSTSLEPGTVYVNNNGDNAQLTEETPELTLGKITIGVLTKYVQLEQATRRIELTDENQNELTDISDSRELYLIDTFYVVAESDDEGIWSTNVLIHSSQGGYEEWCPVTVSADIVDEKEELIINGQNVGVKLPKEIVRAIYSSNYDASVVDEATYARKMKEYLLNYMALKGEMGNYRSVLNGLKWFEWGDRLTISKLTRNDNRVQRQYVRDFFNIINDTLYSYQLFRETSLLSIEFNLTEEGEQELQNLDNYFWGEGKPRIINKIQDAREVQYDEREYTYYKGYFDFTFDDLGLKLCALKYYFEKYFLPLYIRLHNVSMNHQVFANDIKYIAKTSHGITARPVYTSVKAEAIVDEETGLTKTIVINNNADEVYFRRHYKKNQDIDYSDTNKLYVDNNYNEFTQYTIDYIDERPEDEMYYEINDTCLRIPISFPHQQGASEIYDVTLIFSRYIEKSNADLIVDDKLNLYELFRSQFTFVQTDSKQYQAFIVYPPRINKMNEGRFDIMYWLNQRFRIDLIVNNKLYDCEFVAKMPEFNIEIGKLQYKYDSTFSQVESITDDKIKFNTTMYLPNLVTVNNIDFVEEIQNASTNMINYINKYYKESVKFMNKKYLNAVHMFDLTRFNDETLKWEFIDYQDVVGEHITWDSLSLMNDTNNSEDVVNMYRTIFNDDGTYKFTDKELSINKVKYDMYLMHDYERWYVVMISKEPIEWLTKKDKEFKFYDGHKYFIFEDANGIKYKIDYLRSDRKFLLNRYIYIPSGGVNHFKQDDIIVASLKNNDKLCLKLSHGSKWTMEPMSLKMKNINTVESNTELAILSISDTFDRYEPGYYSVSIEYSVDDYAQHLYKKNTQFRIDAD